MDATRAQWCEPLCSCRAGHSLRGRVWKARGTENQQYVVRELRVWLFWPEGVRSGGNKGAVESKICSVFGPTHKQPCREGAGGWWAGKNSSQLAVVVSVPLVMLTCKWVGPVV